jgi:hypothetical protein
MLIYIPLWRKKFYPLIENDELNEEGVMTILREISVPLGGGRIEVSLLELLPMQCQVNLLDLLEEYQKNR